jgi:hypothetical protein
MRLVGHRTESSYRRYAIVDEAMLLKQVEKSWRYSIPPRRYLSRLKDPLQIRAELRIWNPRGGWIRFRLMKREADKIFMQ